MKRLIQLILICSSIVSCYEPKHKQNKEMKLNCEELKKNIQKEFDLKNFLATIKLYKGFEKCLNNRQEYFTKLALLYKENNQPDLSKEQLTKVIDIIENNDRLSATERLLSKAGIYLLMDNKEKVRNELNKLNREELTQAQTEEIEFIELFANQGEFISTSFKTGFILFE